MKAAKMEQRPLLVARAALTVSWLLCAAAGQAAAQTGGPAQSPPIIDYGYPDQSIFIATIDADGQPDSPMIRLAQALMRKAGLPLRATPYPASRLFRNLHDGATNFSILVRGASLETCCILSRKPVYGTDLNVYFIGDKPPVKRKEDLAGKDIVTIHGYSYAGLLNYIQDPANKINSQPAATHKAAFEMLKAQRSDYVVDYATAADDILYESPIWNLHSNSIDRLDIYLVLAKSYPDAEALMRRLEDIAATLDIPGIIRKKPGDR